MIRLAIIGVEAGQRAELSARLRGASVAAWLEAAPEGPTIGEWDAVVITDFSRVEPARVQALLDAGKHVLLSADPSLGRSHWEALVAAAQGTPGRLSIVNPDRYLPSRRLIKQNIGDKLGQVGLVRMHRWLPAGRNDRMQESLLLELDVAMWLVGQAPKCVFALDRDDGQFLQIHLGFVGGAMALIDVDGRLPAGECYRSLTAIGSNGAAYADDHQNIQLAFRGGPPIAQPASERGSVLGPMIQDFVDCLERQEDWSSADSWRDVYEAANKVTNSLRSGQAVACGGS